MPSIKRHQASQRLRVLSASLPLSFPSPRALLRVVGKVREVRAAFNTVRDRYDNRHDAISVGQNVIAPKAERAIALRLEKSRSRFVVITDFALHVSAAIDLNDKLRFVTCKVREVTSDGCLAAKMTAAEFQLAQPPP